MIIEARSASIGAFDVARVLPFRLRRSVGPFTFLDHAGPIELLAEDARPTGIAAHPHIGLQTVTYPFGGRFVHRDSAGHTQVIRPGEVNWMTAGRGISHSERLDPAFARTGGRLEMLQAWVAVPEDEEEGDPGFEHYEGLPEVREDGVWARVLAGSAYGVHSPTKTLSPLFYVHLEVEAGARIPLPSGYSERAMYVAAGSAGGLGRGKMLVFDREEPEIRADERSTVMLLGGEPLGPRFMWWNFVSSRKDRIEQAKADWREGRISLPIGDGDEVVPLPEDRRP
jgi:redox-sensitive bicupin YhaK (pirin superfamily)